MIAILFVLALPPMIRGDTPPVIQVDSHPPIIVVPNEDHPKPMPSLPPLRQAYVAEVEYLKEIEARLRAEGKQPEDIARKLHKMRRDLGIKYKEMTPPELLEKIYARNTERYGDRLGPTIEFLREKGHTWDSIIKMASRPGGEDIDFSPSPKRVRQEWFDIPGVGRRLITIEETNAVPQTPIPAATPTPSPVVNAWVPSIVGTSVLSAPAIVCRT